MKEFLSHQQFQMPGFKLYSNYLEGVSEALALLNTTKHTSANFRKFLASASKAMGTKNQLSEMLVLPTERIPKYRHILQVGLLGAVLYRLTLFRRYLKQ